MGHSTGTATDKPQFDCYNQHAHSSIHQYKKKLHNRSVVVCSHLCVQTAKRSRRGDGRGHRGGGKDREQSDRGKQQVDVSSPVIQAFLVYQSELDRRHDKYERLVKLSRDVTIESKRTIFLLHRISE